MRKTRTRVGDEHGSDRASDSAPIPSVAWRPTIRNVAASGPRLCVSASRRICRFEDEKAIAFITATRRAVSTSTVRPSAPSASQNTSLRLRLSQPTALNFFQFLAIPQRVKGCVKLNLSESHVSQCGRHADPGRAVAFESGDRVQALQKCYAREATH
jgi:hypothetical protein